MNKYKPKVLLVEDEGFELTQASNGIEGMNSFYAHKPDIIIADVMMPGMDGFEMVKKMRSSDRSTPILFLTARSSFDDLVFGFNLGANDYLKKPFKMLELVVRIKALVNRVMPSDASDEIFEIGDYVLNATTQMLTYLDKAQELSYLESEILKRLCIHKNNVVEITNILNDLWNDVSYYNRNSLHIFIHKLRRKLSEDNRIKILNIRGIGYKLTLQQERFLLPAPTPAC